MERAVTKSLTGYLKFTYKGKPHVARASLELTSGDGQWVCSLKAIYGHKLYTSQFNVPIDPEEGTQALAGAISLGILRSIKSWGRPWSVLTDKTVTVELSQS